MVEDSLSLHFPPFLLPPLLLYWQSFVCPIPFDGCVKVLLCIFWILGYFNASTALREIWRASDKKQFSDTL